MPCRCLKVLMFNDSSFQYSRVAVFRGFRWWCCVDKSKPVVGIIMGSKSDLEAMSGAKEVLEEFGVPFEISVVSAHRAPKLTIEYASTAKARGLEIIIAGAGGAAHLPGVVAALTPLPVIGIPIESKSLHGLDSLLSIVQMPGGIPVATVGIGSSKNAGILAVRILALKHQELARKLEDYASGMEKKIRETKL